MLILVLSSSNMYIHEDIFFNRCYSFFVHAHLMLNLVCLIDALLFSLFIHEDMFLELMIISFFGCTGAEVLLCVLGKKTSNRLVKYL